jgi:hypothetical protein
MKCLAINRVILCIRCRSSIKALFGKSQPSTTIQSKHPYKRSHTEKTFRGTKFFAKTRKLKQERTIILQDFY